MQTRASKKRKRSMGMVGVISFCCGGGMLSSQWTGKNFKHIAGLDINPKYGKTFSKNTGGAPLVKCDLFKITRRWALQFKKKYDVAKYEKVVILASLDCCPASNANKKKLTKREKLVWYKKAIAKLKIFTDAMELGPTKVYLFHEFLDDADVIDLLEKAYPEIHKTQTTHHIFEDRRRAFLCQRYDHGMKEFDRELARGCSAYRRRSLVDELRKHGLDVKRDSEIFSKSWTKVEWRLDHDGRSLDCDRLPTITGQGLVLHVVVDASTTPPTVEEVPISPEIALKLRSLGGDRSFEFHSEDLKLSGRKSWAWVCRSSWRPRRGARSRGAFWISEFVLFIGLGRVWRGRGFALRAKFIWSRYPCAGGLGELEVSNKFQRPL